MHIITAPTVVRLRQMVTSPHVTPLLRFLRALTPEQREKLAEACGTTVVYLYQLAAAKNPNPRVRLALALCAESRRLSRKVHSSPLTVEDLTVGPDPHDDSEMPDALKKH
jgi:hypothetical protein